MPFLVTLEEEHMPALTLHWPGLHVLQIDTLAHVKTKRGMKVQWTSPDLHLDGVAPAHQSVALDETVGDEVLVLELDTGVGKYLFRFNPLFSIVHQPGVGDQVHSGLDVDDDVAGAGTLYHLTGALVHDLHGEVLGPALRAEQVPALQPCRHQINQLCSMSISLIVQQ